MKTITITLQITTNKSLTTVKKAVQAVAQKVDPTADLGLIAKAEEPSENAGLTDDSTEVHSKISLEASRRYKTASPNPGPANWTKQSAFIEGALWAKSNL